MSHEIRTPLNAITGLSYLILNSEMTHSQRAHMERIKFASETMLSIINDILDFSKLEAGKVDIEHEPFELDEVIRNVINIVGHRVADKNLNLTLIKNPDIPNCFYGDKVRLGQILLNLMVNAIKFTEEGDVVLEMDLYGYERDQYQLEFKISDTGIGMSAEHLEKLFDPFTQEDASITRRFGGTGLGLSIVKNLVELMDGTIDVQSTPGEGTLFTVLIKLQLDVENERKAKAGFEYIKDIKTLILNKNMSSLSTMVEYLKSFSINPEFTSSEVQFTNIIRNNEKKFLKPYDLVIIFDDSTMEDCEQFFEQIKAEVSMEQLPKVLFIYKYDKDGMEKTMQSNQYAMYEPYLPSMLYNAISNLFKNKLMASQTEQTERSGQAQAQTFSGNILIVEDNETNVLIASELLKSLGFSTDSALNGQLAVQRFESGAKYDLVLMDLHMPVMNGYDASKYIREQSPVPIIAMTADAIEGVREKCAAAGMNDFISKPFDPEKFMVKVKGYFSADDVQEKPPLVIQDHDAPDPKLFDKALGLKLMGGNENLYNQVLMAFAEENTSTLDKIKNCLSENDYASAADLFHKVKSSAGSIGSESVRILAGTLQNLCNEEDSDGIQEGMRRFEPALSRLLEMIHEESGR
jgi:CheY-like chemotaxis protein/HPt (histidine-containing phosphotransfer) domain-containing protein/two-component sensor histidine kinase